MPMRRSRFSWDISDLDSLGIVYMIFIKRLHAKGVKDGNFIVEIVIGIESSVRSGTKSSQLKTVMPIYKVQDMLKIDSITVAVTKIAAVDISSITWCFCIALLLKCTSADHVTMDA